MGVQEQDFGHSLPASGTRGGSVPSILALTDNDTQTYGKITVTLQSSTNYDHYEVRKFQLQDEKV